MKNPMLDNLEDTLMTLALLTEADRDRAEKLGDFAAAEAYAHVHFHTLGLARDLQARGYGRAPSGLRSLNGARAR